MNFANERNQFLNSQDDNNIKNVVFITTDVHFPANILLDQDFNHDGDKLILYELVSGPLTAGASDEGEALFQRLMLHICIMKENCLILDIIRFKIIKQMESLILYLK